MANPVRTAGRATQVRRLADAREVQYIAASQPISWILLPFRIRFKTMWSLRLTHDLQSVSRLVCGFCERWGEAATLPPDAGRLGRMLERAETLPGGSLAELAMGA
jgi:hypothetical protein